MVKEISNAIVLSVIFANPRALFFIFLILMTLKIPKKNSVYIISQIILKSVANNDFRFC